MKIRKKGKKVIGLLGRYLVGKTAIVSVVSSYMNLSKKIRIYLPKLHEKMLEMIKNISNPQEMDVERLELEGLLEGDRHYKILYKLLLETKGLKYGGEITDINIKDYKTVLVGILSEIIKEEQALLKGSESIEVRLLDNLKIRIYPGQYLERILFRDPRSELDYMRKALEFCEECGGRIVWVISPKDLYSIISYVFGTSEKEDIINIIKLVEDRIYREKTYYIISKADNKVIRDTIPSFKENIWDERRKAFGDIIIERSIIFEDDLKHILKEIFQEKYEDNLAKKAVQLTENIKNKERIYALIEVYALLYFTKYYLLKDIGGVLYTSAEERRNVNETIEFFKKVRGGKIILNE